MQLGLFLGSIRFKNNRGRSNQKIKKKADRVISKSEVGGVKPLKIERRIHLTESISQTKIGSNEGTKRHTGAIVKSQHKLTWDMEKKTLLE